MYKKYWEFDNRGLTLTCTVSPYYNIDLTRCGTGSQVMDWIFQIRWKSWMTADIMWSFLSEFESAFKEVFGFNAQSMSAMGKDHLAYWKSKTVLEKKEQSIAPHGHI